MATTMHPAAPHHLPGFITAPGETDVFLAGSAIFLVIIVLVIGCLYFWLHAIPERIAHGSSKLQFQLVAVLSLIALFTHSNAFWIAALLLALTPIPDFWTPLKSMADSLARMAARRAVAVFGPGGQASDADAPELPAASETTARPTGGHLAAHPPPPHREAIPLAQPADATNGPSSREGI